MNKNGTRGIIEKLGKVLFGHIYIGLILLFIIVINGDGDGETIANAFLSLSIFVRIGVVLLCTGSFIVYSLVMFALKFVFEWTWLKVVSRYDRLRTIYNEKRINTTKGDLKSNDSDDKAGERRDLVQERDSRDGGTGKPDIS